MKPLRSVGIALRAFGYALVFALLVLSPILAVLRIRDLLMGGC